MHNKHAARTLGAILVLAAGIACADHLPESKLATGTPDSKICGFDTFATQLKDIEAKLGKPTGYERDPVHEKGVTYRWDKGPLTILLKTYEVDHYQDRPPVWIEVSGSDPDRLCPTGRGIALGDRFSSVRKAYGSHYGVMTLKKGKRMITVEWETLQTMDIDIGADDRVSRINVSGDIE